MKKIILPFLGCLMMSVLSFGQTSFSDDFDSYTPGDWLGTSATEWTTWSGNTGAGADDVTITDEDAASGSNSIKLGPATGGGGPEDVVLYFTGDKFSSGNLDMNLNMKVITGAYFNYQQEVAIGATWAMNAIFDANGAGSITDGANATTMTFSYPMDTWFNFRMATNLDANKWQVFIDGACVGSFANVSDGIASIDIFPRGGDEFFVDDFSYEYELVAPVIVNDAQASLKLSEVNGLVGTTTSIEGILTNVGTSMITEFSVAANIAGVMTPFAMNSLTLGTGDFMAFSIDDNFSMPEGSTDVSIEILSINSGTFDDQDVCNDGESRQINAVSPAPYKKVLVEEATGTWCGWCPRGTVSMDRLSSKYPDNFVGIAVHTGDPMQDSLYSPGFGNNNFPSAKADRTDWVDPGFGTLEPAVLAQAQIPVVATLLNGATWDPVTRELQIALTVSALADISPDYNINIALTEDDVTGIGPEWGQVNFYSGGPDLIDINGVNWSDLPATVNDIDYDHVARAILAPIEMVDPFDMDDDDSFTETLETGGNKVFMFTYTIPEDFNEDKMHLVSMIINPDRSINNSESVTIAEAVANGIVSTHSVDLGNVTNIYPNPFSNTATVSMNMTQASDILIEVMDINGKLVMMKEYQKQPAGLFNITFDGSSLDVGMYVMKITANDKFTAKRLSIIR
ncbi:MAG: thiol-disulfide isomerase/thioredoxin [Polaribacter sp.]|jgi:thiol-disulfide isomerase/thioredoxin